MAEPSVSPLQELPGPESGDDTTVVATIKEPKVPAETGSVSKRTAKEDVEDAASASTTKRLKRTKTEDEAAVAVSMDGGSISAVTTRSRRQRRSKANENQAPKRDNVRSLARSEKQPGTNVNITDEHHRY